MNKTQTQAEPQAKAAFTPSEAIRFCTPGTRAHDIPARLADAAPELLEALRLALLDHDNEGIELNHDTVTAARAAIATATGGAK